MLIQVRYDDNSYGKADDAILESLISSGKILEFQRSSGWVKIGRDPVRRPRVERRRKGVMFNTYA